MVDVLIIGAGPVGLACAIAAQREGLTACVIDKGTLVNSIVGYPSMMEFFSTPELIEIGGYPFAIPHYKPTREDAIEYYRSVAARERLDLRLYERVVDVHGGRGDFTVTTSKGEHRARQMRLEGRRTGAAGILFRPVGRFIRMYLLELGFLEGTHGVALSLLGAFSVYLKYVRLWELQIGGRAGADRGAPPPPR